MHPDWELNVQPWRPLVGTTLQPTEYPARAQNAWVLILCLPLVVASSWESSFTALGPRLLVCRVCIFTVPSSELGAACGCRLIQIRRLEQLHVYDCCQRFIPSRSVLCVNPVYKWPGVGRKYHHP